MLAPGTVPRSLALTARTPDGRDINDRPRRSWPSPDIRTLQVIVQALRENRTQMPAARPYRGRFAPSPTGPLHFGSLVAAMASYLQVRSRAGEWLVRIEDLDPPRAAAGAADSILRTLEQFGFHWDGAVCYQSQRQEAYRAALDLLQRDGAVYPCACSRKEIADSSVRGIEGPVYSGTCRQGLRPGRRPHAWRVRTDGVSIGFTDVWQGVVQGRLELDVGDFVVRRADGLFSYQLAVVVDDASQEITEVVRGADLLESTPRQMHLQRLLGLATPDYAHIPVAVNRRGAKLSKQSRTAPVDARDPLRALIRAADFLGQEPPVELLSVDVREFWAWAIPHWRPGRVPACRARIVDRRTPDCMPTSAGEQRVVRRQE